MKHTLGRLVYRRYRRTKAHFIEHPSPLGMVFFRALRRANGVFSERGGEDQVSPVNRVWKALYFQRYGTAPLFTIETDAPVARNSADHEWPRGAIYDSSVNRRFNLKLYDWLERNPDLSVLDLGCAGGGLVRSFLEDGYTAVGVEGSDVSLRLRSGEWDAIPHHLMTADITAPFRLRNRDGGEMRFSCITAWEVLEHLPEAKVDALAENVVRHLTPAGVFVASVDQCRDEDPLTGAVYHLTLKPREWWCERFAAHGLVEVADHPFETCDYVRGHGRGFKDWDPADGDGFHLVLRASW
jgi:SAM-dependent methyltransferase